MYKPHIDGLRALAVVPVLLFHAGVPHFGGGFVGVDVFFVISGFLIASLIDRQVSAGSFSVVEFYERRARRILPALFPVIFACLMMGMATFPPGDLKKLSASALSTTLFGANFFFWLEQDGYFAGSYWKKPLLHIWSLAVEEQFYIFFPVLLVAARKQAWVSQSKLIAAFLVGSLAVSIWGAYAKPSATFFLLHTRIWELMTGALLAVQLPRMEGVSALLPSSLLAIIGAGLILIPVAIYDSNSVFPGANAIAPCLGAAALLVAGGVSKSPIVRALECRPVVFVGLISYPLYLWHWPLLTLVRRIHYGQSDAKTATLALLTAFALAWLTWRFVETPVRRRRALPSRAQVVLAALAGGGMIGMLSLAGWTTDGLPGRVPKDRRDVADQNERARTEWAYPCDNLKRNVSSTNPIQFCSLGLGNKDGVLLWGDSHVEQLFTEVKRLVDGVARSQLKHVLFATSGGCLPLPGIERNASNFHCEQFYTAAVARALQPDIKRVVISGFWTDFISNQDVTSGNYNFVQTIGERRVAFRDEQDILSFFYTALTQAVNALRAVGKEVALVMPYPTFKYPPAEYMWRHVFYGLTPEALLPWETYIAETSKYRAIIERVAHEAGAQVFDPATILCTPECAYRDGMMSLYKDTNHLVPRGTEKIRPMLMQLLGVSG